MTAAGDDGGSGYAGGPYEIAVEPVFSGITVEEIGRIMGYTDTALPEHFANGIASIIANLAVTCSIRAGYRIADVTGCAKRSDGLEIGGVFFSFGRMITSQLRGAEAVAVFVCTIGSRLEEKAATLFGTGDPVTGHFTDTIASVAVERVAAALHDAVEQRMREQDLGVTNRFSPGYCGWPVAQQHELFGFFPARFCGVTLNDSACMLPKKSISGIIGAGPNAQREPYHCSRCVNSECTYRKFLSNRQKKG